MSPRRPTENVIWLQQHQGLGFRVWAGDARAGASQLSYEHPERCSMQVQAQVKVSGLLWQVKVSAGKSLPLDTFTCHGNAGNEPAAAREDVVYWYLIQ